MPEDIQEQLTKYLTDAHSTTPSCWRSGWTRSAATPRR
jgi:hypothetical protein